MKLTTKVESETEVREGKKIYHITIGHCRSKGIGGNADDKNYKCSRIIHLLNRITSALIVAMPLLGAVLKL